jgi:hypothetical protein
MHHLNVQIGPEKIIADNAYQPFLFQTSAGDLLICGWKALPPAEVKNNRFPGAARWLVSHDGATTWQNVVVPRSEETGTPYVGAGIELPDGRYRLFYYYAWRDNGGSGPFTCEHFTSGDGFRTFNGPVPVRVTVPAAIRNQDDMKNPVDIVTLHRSIIGLPDGSLLASAYCRFEGDDAPCDYLPDGKKWRCIVLRSADEGQTWDYWSTMAVDDTVGQEGFDEASLVRLSRGPRAGRLLCVMRTGSAACPIYATFSDDEGRTWSQPQPTAAIGVDPCLLELSDGMLAFSWGTRLWDVSGFKKELPAQRPTFKLSFSRDGGATWSEPLEFPLESAATGHACNTGYSALAELAPGRLLMAYDLGSFNTDTQYLACRLVRFSTEAK